MNAFILSFLLILTAPFAAQAQLGETNTFINTNSHLVFTQAKPSTFRANTVDVGLVIHNKFTYQYESISNEQFAFEQHKARSIFEATTAGGLGRGTAFLVGPDLVLTNKHLLNMNLPSSQQVCGKFSIKRNDTRAQVNCKKVEFCDDQLDFCLVRMDPIEGLRKLRLKQDLPTSEIEDDDAILFLIGNAEGLGIQAASERGAKKITIGLIYHCVNNYPGTSGSPLLNDRGEVLGIEYAHAGNGIAGISCPHDRMTGMAVSSLFILDKVKRSNPALADELTN